VLVYQGREILAAWAFGKKVIMYKKGMWLF